MRPDPILQLVMATFAELGAPDPQCTSRTVLIQDRYFLGYRFRCGDFQAVWFSDSGEIKFSDASGRTLRAISLKEQLKKLAA